MTPVALRGQLFSMNPVAVDVVQAPRRLGHTILGTVVVHL